MLAFFLLVWVLCSVFVVAADDGLVAWWKFDREKDAKETMDAVSQLQDSLVGYIKYVRGVSGTALTFDGYTTGVVREAAKAPNLGDAFSFEAWIAIQAYPWGLCGVVNQCEQPDVEPAKRLGQLPPEKDPTAGYVFGIDANGRVHLQLLVDGKG